MTKPICCVIRAEGWMSQDNCVANGAAGNRPQSSWTYTDKPRLFAALSAVLVEKIMGKHNNRSNEKLIDKTLKLQKQEQKKEDFLKVKPSTEESSEDSKDSTMDYTNQANMKWKFFEAVSRGRKTKKYETYEWV